MADVISGYAPTSLPRVQTPGSVGGFSAPKAKPTNTTPPPQGGNVVRFAQNTVTQSAAGTANANNKNLPRGSIVDKLV